MAFPDFKIPFADGFPDTFTGTLKGIAANFQTSSGLPDTRTRLSTALTLQVSGPDGRHRIIGAGQEFAPSQQQEVADEWEVNLYGDGTPGDMVYGNLVGRTIRLARLDLYSFVFEEAFGTDAFDMLTEWRIPITLREVWIAPTTLFKSTDRIYAYYGCRCTALDRAMSANDDRIVRATASFVWRRRKRIL